MAGGTVSRSNRNATIGVAAKSFSPRQVQAMWCSPWHIIASAHPRKPAHPWQKGTELAATLSPKTDEKDLGISWKDMLIAKLLLQEAKALLGEK